MNKNSLRTLGFVGVLLACSGCASLMMRVADADDGHASMHLKKGDAVAVSAPSVDGVIEDKKEGAEFATKLRQHIVAELKEEGVATDDHSNTKLEVKITKYETGCGFCRGFFPVFGLGNSFVDGQATLVMADGKRTLLINKTGQASGMAEMGDQTDTNMEYFAKVLASNLTSPGEKGEKAEKETADKD